jgi:hypothetical protein
MFLGPNLANVLRFKNIGHNFPKKRRILPHNIPFKNFLGPNVGECFSKIKDWRIFLKRGIILPHNIIPF